MENLNLPSYKLRLRDEGQRTQIFDPFRKRYVALTPEEWVRQNLLQFLTRDKNYPPGLISVERALQVNKLNRRADAVVFDKTGEPILLVECKAPSVKISQETFDQIARYNITLRVPFLVVSNGLMHYCCKINLKENTYVYLEEIPDFNQLSQS